jgi:hypothetical protein
MITRPLQDDYIFAYCTKEAIVKQEEHDNCFPNSPIIARTGTKVLY